jgi:hypothetical protein
VRSDMEFWRDVRRRVLTGELSRRAACRKCGLGWHTLKKILSHEEPPGYRQSDQPAFSPKAPLAANRSSHETIRVREPCSTRSNVRRVATAANATG